MGWALVGDGLGMTKLGVGQDDLSRAVLGWADVSQDGLC